MVIIIIAHEIVSHLFGEFDNYLMYLWADITFQMFQVKKKQIMA